jgi:hypothetical protein
MDRKDLIFLAAAQATAIKTIGKFSTETSKLIFDRWYDFYDELLSDQDINLCKKAIAEMKAVRERQL